MKYVMSVKRVVFGLLGLGVLAFAVQGGEYGTVDLARQQIKKRQLQEAIDSLERDIDSLTRLKRAIATDPAVQERLAREEFGMVKGDKEILYRLADPADTAKKP